jgi:hypothetical protein
LGARPSHRAEVLNGRPVTMIGAACLIAQSEADGGPRGFSPDRSATDGQDQRGGPARGGALRGSAETPRRCHERQCATLAIPGDRGEDRPPPGRPGRPPDGTVRRGGGEKATVARLSDQAGRFLRPALGRVGARPYFTPFAVSVRLARWQPGVRKSVGWARAARYGVARPRRIKRSDDVSANLLEA